MGVLDDLGKLVDLGKRAVSGEFGGAEDTSEPKTYDVVSACPNAAYGEQRPTLWFRCPCGHERTYDLTTSEPQDAVAATRLHLEQCRVARKALTP